jgi:hypothetical protein
LSGAHPRRCREIALQTVQLRPRAQLKSHFCMGTVAHAPANTLVLIDVPLQERAMDTDPIDLLDLGDATQETKQLMAVPVFLDSQYFLGLLPDIG